MKKVLIFLLIVWAACNLYSYNKDYTQWWIYNHGDYAKTQGKNDPRVTWANEVFERMKNAADKAEGRVPRLFIINTRGEPYALAVPDGGIIITPTTLDICYADPDRKRDEGDQRLAFILGHELAHLGNKDYIHREAFLALKKYGEEKARKKLKSDFKLPENRTKEFLADQNGALNTAMAGYDISILFGKKNNFLQYWANQIGIEYSYDGNKQHPSFQNRVQFVRLQLKRVVEKVELFRAGVLLYQMGNHHDSAAAFIEFSKVYPAREVFNNIGACYFNLAMHHLYLKYREVYYKFRISTTIDYSTTAAAIQPRGEEDYLKDKDISRYLKQAENYFSSSVEKDQYDRTCRYNLAAVLILKKEYAGAQAVCDRILKKDPQDVYALNNKAIAFYYYGKEEDLDTTQKAIHVLEKAHQLEPDNFEVLYNLASLKQERKRMAGAKVYWEKYLKLSTTPKDNFYIQVYKKLRGTAPSKLKEKAKPPQMPAGIRLGEDFSRIVKKWGKEHTGEFKLGIEEDVDNNNESWFIRLQMIVKENVRVLALDGTVELIEQECKPFERKEEILKKFGSPQKIVRHTSGNFYVYKDNGFSFKEINGKIHSYIWFEKDF
jgi:Flp pilus assembly protein TadD